MRINHGIVSANLKKINTNVPVRWGLRADQQYYRTEGTEILPNHPDAFFTIRYLNKAGEWIQNSFLYEADPMPCRLAAPKWHEFGFFPIVIIPRAILPQSNFLYPEIHWLRRVPGGPGRRL